MSDKNNLIINDFEESFEKSLRSLGYLFPTTDDEVIAFQSSNEIEKTPLDFPSATDILKMGRVNSITPKKNIFDNSSLENLARAARKGNEIPDDILKRMQADRKESEDGK